MANDWGQWRGPNRDGLSKETGLLRAWPMGGPRLLWQSRDLGGGYSTPAVSGNRLLVQANEGVGSEFVRAISTTNGKTLWSTRIGKVGNPDQQPSYPGARSTPTIDGVRLYALGSDGDLAALDLASGRILWQKSLRAEFGGKPGVWAYSESPLVDGDKLIVAPGGPNATVIALDKKSGDPIWKTGLGDGDATASYSSAVVLEIGGVRQYVQYLTSGLVGLSASDGKLLWRYDKTLDKQYKMHAMTPVVSGDLVYSAAASGGGAARIKSAPGGGFVAESVYQKLKTPNGLGGAVKIGTHLYGTTSSAQLLCLDFATGNVAWESRVPSPAAIASADGLLYVHCDNSDMLLVEATPAGFREKGKFTPPNLPERGTPKAWAYPVLADGKLYIREQNCLWAYDLRR